jgi:hypothetical protein
MIDRLKEFIEDRLIRRLLKKISEDVFTKKIDFKYLKNKYSKNKKGIDELLIYSIIEIASERTPLTQKERFNSVKNLHFENLKLVFETKSWTSIIEIQALNAEKQFLETKLQRMSAEELMEINKYSFEAMQYRMELASKGALTAEQYDFIKNQSDELSELEKKMMKIKIENNKN